MQEVFVNGVYTRKMEHLAKVSALRAYFAQVSNIAKEMDDQAQAFQNRPHFYNNFNARLCMEGRMQ